MSIVNFIQQFVRVDIHVEKTFGSPRLLPSHARNKTRDKVQAILELHLRSRDQQILQARIINLLKTGFEKEKGGIEVKIGEYLHVYSDLVLLYIDLEVSQL